jgi:hypothetical protein
MEIPMDAAIDRKSLTAHNNFLLIFDEDSVAEIKIKTESRKNRDLRF